MGIIAHQTAAYKCIDLSNFQNDSHLHHLGLVIRVHVWKECLMLVFVNVKKLNLVTIWNHCSSLVLIIATCTFWRFY